MIESLYVKNLALIEEAQVDFGEGLNILSGETGAGKSIIIGSISLALGGKASKELLRENQESAYVELIFRVTEDKVRQALRDLEVEPEDDMVILSRRITAGRSVARICGEAVSASRLQEIAALLIDIHGQHEHQSLLSKKKHLQLLDEYAREALGARRAQLAEAYREYRRLADTYAASDLDSEQRKRELSFLTFEAEEIEAAGLTPGEDEQLERDFRKYSNGKKLLEAANRAYAATGGDRGSASELIGTALREIGMVSEYDAQLDGLEQQLAEIDSLLSDFNHELAHYLSDEAFDEEAFYETQKRLDEINNLKSKYGNTIEEILSSCEEKRKRIAQLTDYDTYLADLRRQTDAQEKIVKQLSEEVSTIRKQKAQELSEAITAALMDLNFLEVRFAIDFAELPQYTANGRDDVQFLISTNPGEPLKPLDKVASGGELSRIMLGIKTVMAERDEIETLIFDEIDSGISGRTAQMVSEKMHALAANHQIICITHLPQIAAMADTHFVIEKGVYEDTTHTTIRRMDEEESVCELARMLGGAEITQTVLDNAREMRTLARQKR